MTKLVLAAGLALALALAGFAGAQALASKSPPLVVVCVNAVEGWEIETVNVGCIRATTIVRGLAARSPNAPLRPANMTCTVRRAGRIAVAIRCAGGGGRFLRADLRRKGAKATPVPTAHRCRVHVDRLKRRWAIRAVHFGCLDAIDVVADLASARLTAEERKDVERRHDVGCWVGGSLPREIACWRSFSAGYFNAQVRLARTPSTTAATTETTEP